MEHCLTQRILRPRCTAMKRSTRTQSPVLQCHDHRGPRGAFNSNRQRRWAQRFGRNRRITESAIIVRYGPTESRRVRDQWKQCTNLTWGFEPPGRKASVTRIIPCAGRRQYPLSSTSSARSIWRGLPSRVGWRYDYKLVVEEQFHVQVVNRLLTGERRHPLQDASYFRSRSPGRSLHVRALTSSRCTATPGYC